MAAQYLWITEAKRRRKKTKKEEREWHFLYLEADINFSKHSRPLQTSAPPLMFLIGGYPLIRSTATRLQAANAFITWITAGATKALGCHWPVKGWMQNCDSHPSVGCATWGLLSYLLENLNWGLNGMFWSIIYLEAFEHVFNLVYLMCVAGRDSYCRERKSSLWRSWCFCFSERSGSDGLSFSSSRSSVRRELEMGQKARSHI